MVLTRGKLLSGAAWTVASLILSQFLRLLANVAMARLLVPELFGFMLIVNTLRTGFELLSDIGILQSIMQNRSADSPEFYNTAWTVQIIRGLILWLGFCMAALPAAKLYGEPALAAVLPIAGLYFISEGLCSMSFYLMQRHLSIKRLNVIGLLIEIVGTTSALVIAYFQPSVWALVLGPLVGSVFKLVWGHLQPSRVNHKLQLSLANLREIFSFGGWILASSGIYFLSINFDRLYLGTATTLAVLGLYGIARTFSDMIVSVAVRLCYFIVFPVTARNAGEPRNVLRSKIASMRLKALIIAAAAIGTGAALGDVPIRVLYDKRYVDAAWMLPCLIAGSWTTVLISLNESTVVALGRPMYGAAANAAKLLVVAIGLPYAFSAWGVLGIIGVLSVAEGCRYVPLLAGQRSTGMAFGAQDALASACAICAFSLALGMRWIFGYGSPFHGLVL